MKNVFREALSGYQAQSLDADPAVPKAAVMLLMYEHDGQPHVIFQKRTDRVEHHKGQISFPGGAADPEDPDLLFTALRETHEEIGVLPGHVDILGRLDQMQTVSNFVVTPYVGWLSHYPYGWQFSHEEVAYLLEVPLGHLLDPRSHVADRRVINGKTYVMPSYEWQGDLIWGATARMLTNFLDVCTTVPAFSGFQPLPAPFAP